MPPPPNTLSVVLNRSDAGTRLRHFWGAPLRLQVSSRWDLTGVSELRAEIHAQRKLAGQTPQAEASVTNPTGAETVIDFTHGKMRLPLRGQSSVTYYLLIRAILTGGAPDVYELGEITIVGNPASDIAAQDPEDQLYASTALVAAEIGNALETVPDAHLSKPAQIHALANNRVAGIEYLAYFHNRLRFRQPVKIGLSGDSTTVEAEVDTPSRREYALPVIGRRRGFRRITAVNRGQSGKSAQDWVQSYLAGDIAEGVDLLILGWGGTNDAGNGATPEEYLAHMRQGLEELRNGEDGRGVDSLSIIVMSSCSTHDPAHGRDASFYEATIQGLKELCREYLCCFLDRYSLTIDSANGGLVWKDQPPGYGTVHDLTSASQATTNALAEIIFPDSLGRVYGNANIENIGYEDGPVTPQLPVTSYGDPLSYRRAYGGSPAWPYDGCVITERFEDGTALQTNYGYKLSDGDTVALRRWVSSPSPAWGPFFILGTGAPVPVTPRPGYTLPESDERMVCVMQNGRTVMGCGYLLLASPGTRPAFTDFAVVPAGHIPANTRYGIRLGAWDGSVFQWVNAVVSAFGQLVSDEAITVNAQRIYLDGAAWVL